MVRKRKWLAGVALAAALLLLILTIMFVIRPWLDVKRLERLQSEDSPTSQYLELMPDTNTIFGWAADLVEMGARKPGTEAGLSAQTYVKDTLTGFGIETTVLETDTTLWECSNWSLTVGGTEIPSYYMTHSFNDGSFGSFTTEDGLSAEIVYVGDGSESDFKNVDVSGKIVMANVKFTKIPIAAARLVTQLYYDPDGMISFDAAITNPYSANTFPYNYYRAMENGAVGFVGVLSDYLESNEFNNEDYSWMGGKMAIPGLWVTNKDAQAIIEQIDSGNSGTVLNMDVTISQVTAGSVIGILPGKSEETIMVQSHYDSSTPGGAEDASGTSVVLAIAKYYSKIPAEQRERTLLFVLMDTHFTDYDSHDAFIEEYLGEDHQILADVCIEHIAKEAKNVDGELVLTGNIEPRIFFTGGGNALVDITKEEIVRHRYGQSAMISADWFDEVPTDADMYYQEGVPIISMITAPIYLYDNLDTADMIAKDQLRPTAELFSDIVWRLMELPAEDFE